MTLVLGLTDLALLLVTGVLAWVLGYITGVQRGYIATVRGDLKPPAAERPATEDTHP